MIDALISDDLLSRAQYSRALLLRLLLFVDEALMNIYCWRVGTNAEVDRLFSSILIGMQ